MTAILLANELSNLIADAKRKNGELRASAEKSLAELKALPTTSEQQIASGKPSVVTRHLNHLRLCG